MTSKTKSKAALEPLVTRVVPQQGWPWPDLSALWEYRGLLYFLAWRDIKVRYKQTLLGAVWAILQPLLTMVVFTVFFGKMARIDSDGLPYPIFSYAALLPWTFFAQGLSNSSNSLVSTANLIRKVYFPRLVIPAATVISSLVDFCLASVVLLALMAYYRITPTPSVLYVPALILLALVTCLGAGIFLAAVNARYRDVRYVVPFAVQLWLFVTPVIYPTNEVTSRLESLGLPGWVFGLNPMAGVVEGFRWALLGTGSAPDSIIWVSVAVAISVFLMATVYFQRTERLLADIV